MTSCRRDYADRALPRQFRHIPPCPFPRLTAISRRREMLVESFSPIQQIVRSATALPDQIRPLAQKQYAVRRETASCRASLVSIFLPIRTSPAWAALPVLADFGQADLQGLRKTAPLDEAILDLRDA